jgi:chromosome segregation ATPase
MADPALTRFHSGIRNPKETNAGPENRAAIRAANADLERRAAQHLEAVVSIVVEQRDEALDELDELRAQQDDWQTQREQLEAEHRRATESMLALHQKELDAVTRRLELHEQKRVQLPAQAPPVPNASSANHALQRQLEAAQAELEAMRVDALQVQAERDRALAAVDDVRLELLSELEAARDEAIDLQTRLDDAEQRAEQIRDEADGEVYRLNEELHELRQQLERRLAP